MPRENIPSFISLSSSNFLWTSVKRCKKLPIQLVAVLFTKHTLASHERKIIPILNRCKLHSCIRSPTLIRRNMALFKKCD